MARRLSDRTPELVIVALAAVLAAGAIALGGGASSGGGAASGTAEHVPRERIALIERRVERLRGLRFRRPVPVAVVTPAEARRIGLAEAARTTPAAKQAASEEVLKLLGLLPADADMRRIAGAIFGEQVAGFYDPRRERLALVSGVGVDDVTLAHELTHALEDQHFDLERLGDGPGDDRSTAEQALAEGTATYVMDRYARRWPSDVPLGDALAGLAQATDGTPLPQYVLRSMLFPYFQGETFVQALRKASDGDWRLVDVALRDRPPSTSAEILQPDRWLRAEQPAEVSLDRAGPDLAAGWRWAAGSTLGEEDLAALLTPQSGPLASRRTTAGWQGGRYALWRRGRIGEPDCAAPCRERDALVLAVRMGTGRQARALGAGLATWLDGGLGARLVASGAAGALWRLPDGSFGAMHVDGADVRAALAPAAGLARRLAAAG